MSDLDFLVSKMVNLATNIERAYAHSGVPEATVAASLASSIIALNEAMCIADPDDVPESWRTDHKLREAHEEAIASIEAQHTKEIEELEKAHEEAIAGLKSIIAAEQTR